MVCRHQGGTLHVHVSVLAWVWPRASACVGVGVPLGINVPRAQVCLGDSLNAPVFKVHLSVCIYVAFMWVSGGRGVQVGLSCMFIRTVLTVCVCLCYHGYKCVCLQKSVITMFMLPCCVPGNGSSGFYCHTVDGTVPSARTSRPLRTKKAIILPSATAGPLAMRAGG